MRGLQYLLLPIFGILFCLPLPCRAEAVGGMKYTARKHAGENPGGELQIKTLNYQDEAAQKTPEEEPPAVRIWNHYKALAAGTPDPEDKAKTGKEKAADIPAPEERTASVPVPNPPEVEKPKAVEEPIRPGGIAGIIDEYRKSKQQRSQMRTITVVQPESETDEGAEK